MYGEIVLIARRVTGSPMKQARGAMSRLPGLSAPGHALFDEVELDRLGIFRIWFGTAWRSHLPHISIVRETKHKMQKCPGGNKHN